MISSLVPYNGTFVVAVLDILITTASSVSLTELLYRSWLGLGHEPKADVCDLQRRL